MVENLLILYIINYNALNMKEYVLYFAVYTTKKYRNNW